MFTERIALMHALEDESRMLRWNDDIYEDVPLLPKKSQNIVS